MSLIDWHVLSDIDCIGTTLSDVHATNELAILSGTRGIYACKHHSKALVCLLLAASLVFPTKYA